MANYESIQEMMNTTENMVKLVNNVGHDDDTLTFDGADWFVFNNVKASTLYVSGNSWIGLGSNSEQLQICRRDAKLWNFYREEATLFETYRVLKIRWEGYAQYNSTSEDVALQYEWFFLETGDMFLNFVKVPKSSGYLGTNRINGGTNQNFTVTAGRNVQYVTFRHMDDAGGLFSIDYDMLVVDPPFDRKYLMADADGKYYKVIHDRAYVDSIIFRGYQLIRTGVIPDQDTRIAISFQASEFNDAAIAGSRKDTSSDKFCIFLSSSTQMHGQFATESTTEVVDDYTGVDVEIELSQEGLKRDGVVILEFDQAEFVTPCELTVGTINTNGTLDGRFFKGKVYYIDIWQGDEQLMHLVPCVDEKVRTCFYDELHGDYFYNEGTGSFDYEDSDQAVAEATHLVEIEIEELTAEVFRINGFDDFPKDEVFGRLVNPELLYWQDSDVDLPEYKATLKAVPPVQVVYSKNNEMIDSTILGIEKVNIEADDTTLFAFSFDGGDTWKAYINEMWVTLSEETSGMSRETVEAIGTDAWNEACSDKQYMVRFTLIEGGYVNRIIIHYIN